MALYKHPQRIVEIIGNKEAGSNLRGFANAQMLKLERFMSFRGLKQGSKTTNLGDGFVVECWSCFSIQHIKIYAPSYKGGGEEESCFKCMCHSCFSIGQVIEITGGIVLALDQGEPIEDATEYCGYQIETYPPEFLCSSDVRYNVEVCGGDKYYIFENCSAYDHVPFCAGDIVILTVYPTSEASMSIINKCINGCTKGCTEHCISEAVSALVSFRLTPIDIPEASRWYTL